MQPIKDKIFKRKCYIFSEPHRSIVSRQVLVEEPVAFFAAKQAHQDGIGINQNIKFDNVPLNLGNGYHPGHGLFIAPKAGLYLFSSSLLTHQVNGNTVAKVYGHGDSGRHDQGSQTVLVRLDINDEVYVRNIDIANDYVYGELASTFSGVLLYDM